MPVSHALKCIFVHIPKTGGTSIESALGLLGDWRVEDTHSMYGIITSPDLKRGIRSTAFLQHLDAEQLRGLLPHEFRLYYRFAFIRNPWERMVSIYSRMDPHMQMSARSAGLQLDGTSFDEFLERTENFEHVHLTPQHTFVFGASGACLVDFLGRFERLTADFADICASLGLERALPHLNKSMHVDYRTYYNQASRRIIERRYGEDIERFGYMF